MTTKACKIKKVYCHVCKREKKPYTVVVNNNIFTYLDYLHAREDGEICQRCDSYYAMTSEFKDATEEEYKKAKIASWFAHMVNKWWEKDKPLNGHNIDEDNFEEDKRDWEGTVMIAKWCRENLTESDMERVRTNKD